MANKNIILKDYRGNKFLPQTSAEQVKTDDGNLNNSLQKLDSQINELATVATTGNYEDLINKPSFSDVTAEVLEEVKEEIRDCVNEVIETIPMGLKVPTTIAKESDLPQLSTLSVGDYFTMQDMDLTYPEHSGRAWVNYTDPNDTTSPLIFYKMFDEYQSPDGVSIVLTNDGKLTVSTTWLNDFLNSKVATSTTAGLIKIASDTVQTVAANAPTSTASRTYPVQKNADGQAVVNVNWTDSNTTYSTITQAQIDAGSATTAVTVTPKLLGDNFANIGKSPNFSEKTVTSATWSDNLATAVTLGTGWTLSSGSGVTGTYTHSTGNTAVLSFIIPTNTDVTFYKIQFTCTGANSTNNFNIVLSTTATGTSGTTVKSGVYYNTTFVVEAPATAYAYLNIVPTSDWAGSFTLTNITKSLTQNSVSMNIKDIPLIVKSNSLYYGKGGKLSTGDPNTAYGMQSLYNNTTGASNTATGYSTLRSNTTGSSNTANGANALYNNTTASYNSAFGASALYSNTIATYNTAMGYYALYANTTGSYNTAIGGQNLRYNTTGNYNSAIGYSALRTNSTGNYNSAVGYYALYNNTTGLNNSANGYYALYNNTTGVNNTANGYCALYNNAIGSYNSALGSEAGRYLSDGSTAMQTTDNSCFFGANTRGSASDSQTNQIVIGYNAIGGGSNSVTLGNSSITKLRCQVTAITSLSDVRVKEEIEDANLNLCVDSINKLRLKRFKYKKFTGTHLDNHVLGFLAHEFKEVYKNSVSESDQYFPVLDENNQPIYEEIEAIEETIYETGEKFEQKVIRKVQKMELMEKVQDITPTELVPTLVGVVQALAKKNNELEERLKRLEKLLNV